MQGRKSVILGVTTVYLMAKFLGVFLFVHYFDFILLLFSILNPSVNQSISQSLFTEIVSGYVWPTTYHLQTCEVTVHKELVSGECRRQLPLTSPFSLCSFWVAASFLLSSGEFLDFYY